MASSTFTLTFYGQNTPISPSHNKPIEKKDECQRINIINTSPETIEKFTGYWHLGDGGFLPSHEVFHYISEFTTILIEPDQEMDGIKIDVEIHDNSGSDKEYRKKYIYPITSDPIAATLLAHALGSYTFEATCKFDIESRDSDYIITPRTRTLTIDENAAVFLLPLLEATLPHVSVDATREELQARITRIKGNEQTILLEKCQNLLAPFGERITQEYFPLFQACLTQDIATTYEKLANIFKKFCDTEIYQTISDLTSIRSGLFRKQKPLDHARTSADVLRILDENLALPNAKVMNLLKICQDYALLSEFERYANEVINQAKPLSDTNNNKSALLALYLRTNDTARKQEIISKFKELTHLDLTPELANYLLPIETEKNFDFLLNKEKNKKFYEDTELPSISLINNQCYILFSSNRPIFSERNYLKNKIEKHDLLTSDDYTTFVIYIHENQICKIAKKDGNNNPVVFSHDPRNIPDADSLNLPQTIENIIINMNSTLLSDISMMSSAQKMPPVFHKNP